MNNRNWMLTGGAALMAAFAYAAGSHGLVRSTCHSGGTSSCAMSETALPPTPAQTAVARTLDPARVSLYDVPLTCPAAPHIGCGSASKPLLLELEHDHAVSEAWLNRAGTILAVVWSGPSSSAQRSQALEVVLQQSQVSAKELAGDARQKALKEFQSGSGWYRGADVDRLSEEEAGIIAARLTARIRERITLTDAQALTLQTGTTGELKKKLTGQSSKEEMQAAVFKIWRDQLGEKNAALLSDAFNRGELRPRGDEK